MLEAIVGGVIGAVIGAILGTLGTLAIERRHRAVERREHITREALEACFRLRELLGEWYTRIFELAYNSTSAS